MGYATKVMMPSINILLSRSISGVSFKFITCVQFEVPLYTSRSASGIMRIKPHEELITFSPPLYMQHLSCNQCCFFSVTFKIFNLFHNLLKFRESEQSIGMQLFDSYLNYETCTGLISYKNKKYIIIANII